jgi:hypothetical protein
MNDVVKKAGKEGQERHGEENGQASVKISRFSKFKGLIAGLGLVTALHACGENETQPPTIPPQCASETGADAECTDGGTEADGGSGGDGGTASDGGTSGDGGTGGHDGGTGGMDSGTGGMDSGTGGMDAGTGGMDAGTGGMDSGTGGDGGSDGGIVLCPSAVLEAGAVATYNLNIPEIVGNIAVTYRGLSGGQATFDATCGGTIVAAGDAISVGFSEDYDLGAGKILTISVHSAIGNKATATVSVHN